MAVTETNLPGNGTAGPFTYTFPALEAAHVKVSVDAVAKTVGVDYSLDFVQKEITFLVAPYPTAAETIRIYRETDDSALAATFYSGAAIRATDLNDNFTQNLYVTQEIANNSLLTDGSNPMVGDLDLNGNKIVNLGTPTTSTDASTKGYVDSVIATGAANAAAAAASFDSFDDRYLGAKTTEPTVDNDGDALLVGAIYFNSTSKVMRVWDGANWKDSSANANLLRWRKTAVGGETTLSGNDDSSQSLTYPVNLEAVFLNGALLQRGVDYVATTGNSITGLVALTAGDVVEVLAFSQVSLLSIPSNTVTFTQSGTGAVQRTIESKLKDVVSVKDFGAVGDGVTDDTAAIQAAMSYGIANGKTVVFDFNATIRIPNDAPTLQDAIDHATVSGPYELDLMIQSGHQPNSGVDVSNGDYGFFKISSVDAVVTLGSLFPATAIIKGTYARMPRLNCLIDANGKGRDGYYANIGSIGWVSIGCGIDNAQEQGCHARTGSLISCGGALFRNASQAAPLYSGILSWGSIIYAFEADVSNSNYYGAQAAAGGILHFRQGIADGCARHNIRATQAGIVHARYASAQNGGVSGVRAFDKSIVHADSVDVTGSDTGIWAQYGSEILAKGAIANNTTASTIYCDTSSKVVASSLAATTTSIATVVRSENGSEVQLDGATISCPNARALNATNSSRIVMLGGSLSGGDGTRLLGVMDSSKISLKDTNTTCTGAEPYMATVEGGSELSIFDGTHTFPNDSINLIEGSILRLHGSGITATSVPGVTNDTLYGRGIMWGAS